MEIVIVCLFIVILCVQFTNFTFAKRLSKLNSEIIEMRNIVLILAKDKVKREMGGIEDMVDKFFGDIGSALSKKENEEKSKRNIRKN